MSDPDSTFRLVFESDLTGEPAVRDRVDAVMHACTLAVTEVIAEDTELDHEAAMLLAAGLTGIGAGRSPLVADPGRCTAPGQRRAARRVAWRGAASVGSLAPTERPSTSLTPRARCS